MFILLFIATSLLYSCDQVDVINRYVEVSTNQPDSSDSMPDSAIVFERTICLRNLQVKNAQIALMPTVWLLSFSINMEID